MVVAPSILHSAPQHGRKMRDGKYRVIGCPHIRPAFGPHDTMGEAQGAVATLLSQLHGEKARRIARLNELTPSRLREAHYEPMEDHE